MGGRRAPLSSSASSVGSGERDSDSQELLLRLQVEFSKRIRQEADAFLQGGDTIGTGGRSAVDQRVSSAQARVLKEPWQRNAEQLRKLSEEQRRHRRFT